MPEKAGVIEMVHEGSPRSWLVAISVPKLPHSQCDFLNKSPLLTALSVPILLFGPRHENLKIIECDSGLRSMRTTQGKDHEDTEMEEVSPAGQERARTLSSKVLLCHFRGPKA